MLDVYFSINGALADMQSTYALGTGTPLYFESFLSENMVAFVPKNLFKMLNHRAIKHVSGAPLSISDETKPREVFNASGQY